MFNAVDILLLLRKWDVNYVLAGKVTVFNTVNYPIEWRFYTRYMD